MQVILGANGSIGVELAKSLTQYTSDIRLVSRNPRKVNETDQLFSADLTSRDAVFKAVEGSSVCYVTIGFEYKLAVWQANWPAFIGHVIDACEANRCRLVFFDNIYAIGKDHVQHITEQSPFSPSSKKGTIRAELDQQIIKAAEAGKIDVVIARAPDFYGPIKQSSLLMNLVYDNYVKGKSAQWFCNADVPHSFGYTPELAWGTALLGNTDSAYNEIWNLPVSPHAPTGREWATIFSEAMGVKNKIKILPEWAIRALGWFVPVVGEMHEMLYQYDRPYVFDSSKFNQAFQYVPLANELAVAELLQKMKEAAA